MTENETTLLQLSNFAHNSKRIIAFACNFGCFLLHLLQMSVKLGVFIMVVKKFTGDSEVEILRHDDIFVL